MPPQTLHNSAEVAATENVQSHKSPTGRPAMTDNQNPNDSTTLGAKQKTRFTTRLTIRCDPKTKEAILTFARQSGLSLCQIYDALTKAFLHGVSVQKDLGTQSHTINLTIERMVKRPRRYSVEAGVGEGVAMVDYYDSGLTCWRRVSAEEYGVNASGHGVGCGCKVCTTAKEVRP